MSAKISNRPICRYCNKPLPQYRHRNAPWAHKLGKGHWGRRGDDLFCGLTCGYYWAIFKLHGA